jgi:GT2 family glycosyltransferase
MDKVSIVIPTYNKWALVHQTLFDIYNHCSPVHEIIVVNDGCTEQDNFTGLEWWKRAGMLPIRELRLEQNVNFLRASNAGLKAATGDILVLLSNDVRVHKDVALMAIAGMSIQEKILLGGRVYNQSTGWNEFNGKIFPYVEGWLLITTKENWEELGYFDERYAPHDFEDVDLSTTAISKGYNLAQITPDNGEVVTHIGAQSIGYNSGREEITNKNREKFIEKWLTNK